VMKELPPLLVFRRFPPPSIHLLHERSAFEIRAGHQPDAWHHDVTPPAIGASVGSAAIATAKRVSGGSR
jgi:hypothetical protein